MSQAKVDRYKKRKRTARRLGKGEAPASARCCLRLAGCHRARRLGWCVGYLHL